MLDVKLLLVRKTLALVAGVSVLVGASAAFAQQPPAPVTTASLLTEMVDRDAVAKWPAPEFVSHQASSYDRASTTPKDPSTWFANHDWSQFVRSETNGGRREWVLMDADGPGCLTRLWWAGDRPPDQYHLRIYLDGSTTPALEGAPHLLMSGEGQVAVPLAIRNPPHAGDQGGLNLFVPIPYAKHCKITWDGVNPKDAAAPPDLRWYNVEYRTYALGTRVQTFAADELQTDRDRLAQVDRTLLSPPEAAGKVQTLSREVRPGGNVTLDLPRGPAAVRQMELDVKTSDPAALDQALRSTIVAVSFDGTQTVWCPAGDFFGSGTGLNELHSWYRDVSSDGHLRCRWTMPYARTARITLTNLGGKAESVTLKANTGRWAWDGRSLLFHANWRQGRDIPTRPYSDWNYMTATGQGVYVGDTLSVYTPAPDWWGEGDEKVWVDGEAFPSHFGTGTEDYYEYAWGHTSLFQGPFSNQVRVDGPANKGNTVVTRTRNLDTIPFTQSLKFDMEIWNWADCRVRYAVATYWYARPGATSSVLPDPGEARQPIPPSTATGLKAAGITGGVAEAQASALWKSGQQLWWRDGKPGDTLSLPFTVAKAGRNQITLSNTYARDYGIIQFSVDGVEIGPPVDFYSPEVVVKETVLGARELTAGRHVLQCRIVGANPAAEKRYMAGIEWIHAETVK